MSGQFRTWSFICVFVKNCWIVAWFAIVWDGVNCVVSARDLFNCGFYLLLSCEIGWVIWILSSYVVWRVYRFWGYRSYGFRSLSMYFQSTTIVFEIIKISVPYSFPTVSYRFCFWKTSPTTKKNKAWTLFGAIFQRGSIVLPAAFPQSSLLHPSLATKFFLPN